MSPPLTSQSALIPRLTEGVTVINQQGEIIFIDRIVEQLLGYEQGSLLGCSARVFLPDRQALSLNYEETHHLNLELRHRSGRNISTIVTVSPIQPYFAGRKMMVVVSRPELEHFRQAITQLQRLASIGTLTASVAHELSNPISIITNVCNNLQAQIQEKSLDNDSLLRHLHMIEQSAWRTARLVQSLRNYTNKPEVGPVEIKGLVEETLVLVMYQFTRQHNIAIESHFSPDLKTANWDQNQIAQVLINLLLNARDALIPAGGTIHLLTQHLPDSDQVAITVRDSGAGIPPDLLDKIFEPFFTTKPAGEGMGLGLSISADIVAQHGGKLTATNDPAGGTTFTITLPYQ